MQEQLDSLEDTELYGAELSKLIKGRCVIHLYGDLGAGKTTLVRGFLRKLGYTGKVKSPTYTLVEEYSCSDTTLYHFDLYRLEDPEELTYIGVDDYFRQDAVFFVEWPDKGKGYIPDPDMTITLSYQGDGRLAELRQNCEES